MKYSELHKRFIKAGWKYHHAEGSHYFYEKNGVLSEPIPYHGAKEIRYRFSKQVNQKVWGLKIPILY